MREIAKDISNDVTHLLRVFILVQVANATWRSTQQSILSRPMVISKPKVFVVAGHFVDTHKTIDDSLDALVGRVVFVAPIIRKIFAHGQRIPIAVISVIA